MKFLLRILKIAFLFLLVVFLLRGWLFRQTVRYQPTEERQEFALTDPVFQQKLENLPAETSIEKIIRQALDLTAGRLHFRTKRTENDPNLSFHNRRAHCVGYAAFFATTCNKLLQQAGLENRYHARHLRGEMFLLGINLHLFSNDLFFKDHDFNVVEDKLTGEQFFIDASVRDYLGIAYVRKQP
jgi:hypothetical protein